MITDRKFLIKSYLELARLSSDEIKKEEYILKVENLISELQSAPHVRLDFSLDEETGLINEFLDVILPEIKGKVLPSKYLFNLFMAYADSLGEKPKVRQRGFTTAIKPYMEQQGYIYDSKHLYPHRDMNKEDLELITKYTNKKILFYEPEISRQACGFYIED